MTFICTGSPARSTVGVIHTCPRCGCSPWRSCSAASSSASATIACADGAVRVAALERHRPVGHLAGEVEAQPQGALGDVADLAALGLAADDARRRRPCGRGRRGPWRRASSPPRRRARRARCARGTGRAAAGRRWRRASPPARPSCRPSRGPYSRPSTISPPNGSTVQPVALGHDVGVALEHQRRTRAAAAVDDGDHVRPPGLRRRRAAAPSRTTRIRSATSSAAGCSLSPRAGSWTLGMRTSCWVNVDQRGGVDRRSSGPRRRQVGGSKRPSAAVQPPSTKIVVPVT